MDARPPGPSLAFPGHRGACDECSQRKVRCTSVGGACHNCISWGKRCTYSPKFPVGRPRKRPATASSNGPSHDREWTKPAAIKPIQPLTLVASPVSQHRHDDSSREPSLVSRSTSSSSWSSQVDLLTPASDNYAVNHVDIAEVLDSAHQRRDYGDYDCSPLKDVDDDFVLSGTLVPRLLGSTATQAPTGTCRTSDCVTNRPRLNTMTHQRAYRSEVMSPTSCGAPSGPPYGHPGPPNTLLATRSSKPTRQDSSLTVNTLLQTVLRLRGKYENLVAVVASVTSPCRRPNSATSYSPIGAVADDVVSAASHFYDEVEPYLSSQQSQSVSGPASMTQYHFQETQTMICLIMTASSTILDIARAVQSLHTTVLVQHGAGGMSSRLEHMLRLSTIGFHMRRCQRSLGLVMQILTRAASHGLVITKVPVEGIQVAARDAAVEQRRVQESVDKLKVPDHGRFGAVGSSGH